MLLSLRNVVIIAVLVASLLTSMPAAYVFAVEGEGEQKKGTDTPKKETETTAVGSSSSQQDTPKSNQEETPQQQSQPQEPPKTTATTTTSTGLPKCDGSFRDCTTRNGDTCKAGEGGEKCECLPDNSDCPNNPNVTPVVPPLVPNVIGGAGGPDASCDFHPNADKCKPDANGNCPPGFSHNDKGNCHPSGPCPSGFHRVTDDESGTCFPNHKPDHNKPVVIVKHTGSSSNTGNSNNHNLSGKCFDAIKIAWLGKISRGENSRVDSIIDQCLGIP